MRNRHFARIYLLSALLAVSGLPGTARALSILPGYPDLLCDSGYVFGDEGRIVIYVQPTHLDDTDNLHCALAEATRMGVPTVQLISADYYISSLSIEGFNGTLQGTSKSDTVINVLDGSVDCSAFIDANRVPAAVKFIGGEPRIRYLKMIADQPCNDEWAMTAMIHFTGAAASENQCSNDVIFGVVDRVIVDGTNSDTGPRIGISAQSEGYQLHPLVPGACNRNLLGTFKLNRSELYNTAFGVVTSMRSNAQVDINYNTFRGQDGSVWIENANQNTTVTKNTFLGQLVDSNYYAGVVQTVYLEGGDPAPRTSRLVINENSFELSPFAGEELYGVLLIGRQTTDISSVITRNTFHLSSAVYAGIATADISNGNIAANTFRGDEADFFSVEALILNDLGESTVTGWTVSGNDFSMFNATFYATTSGNYFGPDQSAGIFDAGSGNIVIEDGNYPWIIDLEKTLNLATNVVGNKPGSRPARTAGVWPRAIETSATRRR